MCRFLAALSHNRWTVLVQGAELMGKHGINAPPGMPIQKIEDLLPAAKKMADSDGEVRGPQTFLSCIIFACMHAVKACLDYCGVPGQG